MQKSIMKLSILSGILLMLLSTQFLQAQNSLPFDIKKKLDAGKAAHVEVFSKYASTSNWDASSLIVYTLSLQEEADDQHFYHIQIKRVLFEEDKNEKRFSFDSYHPPTDHDLFEAQEALAGASFWYHLNELDPMGDAFIEQIYEQALGQKDVSLERQKAMMAIYDEYFSKNLFRQHLGQMLGFPSKNPAQAQVSYKLLHDLPHTTQTVISGQLHYRQTDDLKLSDVGIYIYGIDDRKQALKLEKDGSFRFSFELYEASRVHLSVKGVKNPLILFLMPGDHLRVHINLLEASSEKPFNEWLAKEAGLSKEELDLFDKNFLFDKKEFSEMYSHTVFSGDRAAENAFMQEYIQTFRGQDWRARRLLKPKKDLFSSRSAAEMLLEIQSEQKASLIFYDEKAHDGFAPAFEAFFKTEMRYFYDLQQDSWGKKRSNDLESLLIPPPPLEDLFQLNVSAFHLESSFWYKEYLNSFFYYKLSLTSAHDFESAPKGKISAENQYHFISMVFDGYPRYVKQAQMLVDCYKEKNISIHLLDELAESFLENCQDESLNRPVRQAMERADNLKQGMHIPPFILQDTEGREFELNSWQGEACLLIFSASFTLDEIQLFQQLNDEFPELELRLVEHPNKAQRFPRAGYSSIPWNLIPRIIDLNSSEGSSEIPFREASSSIPGTKFPPQFAGNPGLWALDLEGSKRYYGFLIDKEGIIQSEWGEDILSRPENLLHRAKWIVYKDKNDNPWLEAEVLWPVALFLLSSPILFFLLLRLYRRRTRRREAARRLTLERELKGIRAQLNPHFLFNAMGSIQNLVDSARPEEANHYLSQFSTLMRQVLSHSQEEMIPLADEVDLLRNYLELEALRHHFQWEIQIDPRIDIHNTEVPSMMLQPYVENAILHGIAGMGAEGKIFIKIDKLKQQLLLSIEDNGIGIENTLALQAEKITQGNGLGMKLTQERMEKLGHRYGGDFRIMLHDRMYDELAATGTRVEVWIPTED